MSITGKLVLGADGVTKYVVTYADGAEEHHEGQLLEVSWLAIGAGLHQVHDPDGFRWAKD